MNILITGGLGFIGSNLAIKLVSLGAKVSIVDALIDEYGGNEFNIAPVKEEVDIRIGDVRDRKLIDEMVKGKDVIFNLAGQVSHIDSMKDPFTDLDINCTAQLSLLESCRYNNPDTKIIFAGTRQVYGKPQYLPVDEKHLLEPTDVNGINKMAGEWYHILYNNVYGIRACSLRLTNTYGPRQLMKHNKQGFTGIFVRQAVQGEKITLYGDGKQSRDFNYVDDVTDAFIQVAENETSNGKIYNLGHKNHYSLKQFVEILQKYTSVEYEFIPFPEEKKKIDIGDYYSDFSKIEKEVSWKPKVDLEEGLKRMVEYYKENLKYYV